ncbi:MAG: DUF4438 domain-containing protein [Candidatus Bathyarchaeota archaeon]|jgi:hypothetical protein|nr:DUF4438 domain-containing protein [Candidatus Bathyarchaeota archaeon]
MIETNKDKLLKVAVQGEIVSPTSRGYRAQWDGQPKLSLGMGGIKYNLKVGDPCFGWASGDHVEPGVTIRGKERPRPSECALALLACIGNEAVVVSGEAKGEKGVFTGRHAGSDDLVWFPDETLEKLAIGDKVQVKAYGVGLRIKGFEDIRVNKCDPRLLESLGIEVKEGKLVVPVVAEIPGFLMGSGTGAGTVLESVDYDIQTTDPKAVKKYNMERLRLGDVVCLRDQLCTSGRGYYQGAVTIGVIIHGASDYSGHGPGVNPILSTKDGRLETRIEPTANTALYLGLRDKL